MVKSTKKAVVLGATAFNDDKKPWARLQCPPMVKVNVGFGSAYFASPQVGLARKEVPKKPDRPKWKNRNSTLILTTFHTKLRTAYRIRPGLSRKKRESRKHEVPDPLSKGGKWTELALA